MVTMTLAAAIGLGVASYSSLRVDLLPPIEIPKVSVETRLPDASAQQTVEAITRPVETAVRAIEGVSHETSTTRDGISLVTADLEYGSDLPLAAIDLREKLDQLRDILPLDATRATIHRTDPSTAPVLVVCIGWNGCDSCRQDALLELRELVSAVVKRPLEQLEGVARASVIGGTEREITILVDPDRLGSFGLRPDRIARAVKASNVNVASGVVQIGTYLYPLRAVGRLATPDDVARISHGQTTSGRNIHVAKVVCIDICRARRLVQKRCNKLSTIWPWGTGTPPRDTYLFPLRPSRSLT